MLTKNLTCPNIFQSCNDDGVKACSLGSRPRYV